MIRTVTFDANTLEKATRPERCVGDPHQADYFVVHAALKDGRIKGYFSQTYCSLEGIERRERPEVLAKTAVGSHSTSSNKQAANITIEIRHHRPPLNDAYEKAVQAALGLGLRALRGPARWVDGLTRPDPDQSFYVIEPIEQVVAHREKANEVAAAIEQRGVGRAVALKIGNEYNKLAGVTSDKPKLWLQGLAHAQTSAERTTVERAIAEWSDGDGIASHVGYGFDLFCSHDFGKSAGGPSIMNLENRAWLSKTYAVVFVTLSELAKSLTAG
ncbi:hypothetical protein [Paraburkholderia fungorum]|uniref:hypothetical protein n=1 Tax=Paraburkholderia fungorum TaxID=134537 RepID=UPI0038781AA7